MGPLEGRSGPRRDVDVRLIMPPRRPGTGRMCARISITDRSTCRRETDTTKHQLPDGWLPFGSRPRPASFIEARGSRDGDVPGPTIGVLSAGGGAGY
jgi:hypothetical protein